VLVGPGVLEGCGPGLGSAIERGPEVPDAVSQAFFRLEGGGIFGSVAGQPMATLRRVGQGPDAAQDVIDALGPRSPCMIVAAGHRRIVATATAMG